MDDSTFKKHFAVKYNWFCEHLIPQNIQLVRIATDKQLGDLFTRDLRKLLLCICKRCSWDGDSHYALSRGSISEALSAWWTQLSVSISDLHLTSKHPALLKYLLGVMTPSQNSKRPSILPEDLPQGCSSLSIFLARGNCTPYTECHCFLTPRPLLVLV